MYGRSQNLHTDDLVTSGVTAPEVSARYQNLIDANPYRNASYRVSPWQQFLSWLGFRSKADDWKENMAVQAQEYDASILQKAYNEDYDDPSSQVARMKAAGLNPDIDPSSIDSSSSSPMPEDPSTPMMADTPQATIASFADGIMNIASTAIGIVGSVQGIARNALQNRILSIEGEQGISALAEKMAPYFLPESDKLTEDGYSWQYQALEGAKIFSRSMDKRSQKRFLDTIQSYWHGAYGSAKSYEEFKHNLESKFSHQLSTHTLEDDFGQLNIILAEELGKANQDILKLSKIAEKASLKSETAESEYNAEYFNELEGQAIAGSENAQADFNETNLKMNDILNESIGRIIDRLEKSRQEGGIGGGLSSVALALLASFRLMISTQGLPSVSRSSSSGVSSWSKGSGSSMHGSNTTSIGW